jgi:hypothetical protein
MLYGRTVTINQMNTLVPVYPVVSITGECLNPFIQNSDTGEVLVFERTTLGAGDVMTIFSGERYVEVNAGRVYNYSGVFFPLVGATAFVGGAQWRGAGFTMSVTLQTAERGMAIAPVRAGAGVAGASASGRPEIVTSLSGGAAMDAASSGSTNGKGRGVLVRAGGGASEVESVG